MPTLKDLVGAKERASKIVDFPVYDGNGKAIGQVLLKLLKQKDYEDIQIITKKETARKLQDDKVDINSDVYKEIFEYTWQNIANRHVLFRLCKDPANPDFPFFTTPDEIGDLAPDVLEYFNIQYGNLRNLNPLVNNMSFEEMEKYIEDAAKDAEFGTSFLERCLPIVQVKLFSYLVEGYWKLKQTANGLSLMNNSLGTSPSREPSLKSKKDAKNPNQNQPPTQ
jgi:hypothetical protein